MWSLVTYSTYFEIYCTTVESAKVCLCLVLFNTVIINTIIYKIMIINNDYTWYNICSAWFLDIRIYQLIKVQLF